MKKRITIVLLCVVLLLGCVGAAVWQYLTNVDFEAWTRRVFLGERAFDSATWKEGDPKARALMAWDLRRRQHLMFDTPQQVHELLGEPDARQRTINGDRWAYALDYGDRPFCPQWDTFSVTFADERRSQHVGLVIAIGFSRGEYLKYIMDDGTDQDSGVWIEQPSPEE